MRLIYWAAPVLAVFSLDFDIRRGTKNTLSKRDNYTTDFDLDDGNVYYVTKLQVGSNKEEVEVIISTLRADTWVHSSDCSVITDDYYDIEYKLTLGPKSTGAIPDYPKDLTRLVNYYSTKTRVAGTETRTIIYRSYDDVSACTRHGTFNTASSDSFNRLSFVGFYSIFAYQDSGYGVWVSDDVSVGGHSMKNLTFGVTTNSSLPYGALGLGLMNASSFSRDVYVENYMPFPMRLKHDGVIKKTAYSLSVGGSTSSKGSVLFGAVDHSKYEGQLQKVKMVAREHPYVVDPNYDKGLRQPNIVLSSIEGDGLMIKERIGVSIASDVTANYLPTAHVERIGKFLDGEETFDGLWKVSCDHLESRENLTFGFSGIKINVPIKDLIIPSTSQKDCFLHMYPQEGQVYLGDSFLRNAYAVFDLENEEIALAQAAHGVREPDIEEIVEDIPRAINADEFNETEIVNSMVWISDRPGYTVQGGLGSSTTSVSTSSGEDTPESTITSATESVSSSSSSSNVAPVGTLGSVVTLLSILCAIMLH
ncbi:aspartyl protease [Candidozyma auris]|uniref:Peptidase A1 domain-containing protein n=1 Tax=Candidozyma auris TaxID=498019 RepID=A0A2H0ZNT2_CANAR|nr:hypothetical protein B9J08_003911 [[Candida] auris]